MYKQAVYYFCAVLLIAVIGFYPSYFGDLAKVDLVHHFHGITATLWMLMLIVQSWLMRTGKIQAHRLVGRGSLLLVPLFIVSGVLMMKAMLTSPSGFSQAFGSRLVWIDTITLITFAMAYGAALYHRKSIQLHARFMASTAVLVLPPALGRIMPKLGEWITSFEMAVHLSYAICFAAVLCLIYDDYRKGKLRAPYLILLVSVALQQYGFFASPGWSWWMELTNLYK
ncbi:hypothetical protein H8K35_14840 [Undibacterium sp. LX40W]|uniref:Uncharacterized protein n=1 Tax=Undibacterium nitidum TaxID=2762298 RepID=A0A923HRC8_9BURK|nr:MULTISPECIES: hypothetical protein [Undibacterium]MBC3882666.1 hypothetical protein [Undibacterium nitidum]MBC3892947.1 hypothetical protein [Undibacterium sp. LX40W]